MKTIQRFLTVGLFMAIVLLGFLEPAMAELDPKIHVLFVWGTKAADTRDDVEKARRFFESEMAEIDICQDGRYIASFTSLSGDGAHPRKILEHCKKMAQEAGPNDALFVYILCHSCAVHLDNANKTPESCVHALSPVAADADYMDLRTIGIKRSSIIKAMKSGNHRLNVLITDSPSVNRCTMSITQCRCAGVPVFRYLLLNETGTINWGSTNPIGGSDGSGEASIGTQDGTLFMHSFFSCRFRHGSLERYAVYHRNSSDIFFNDLGAVLVDDYKYARKNFENDHPILFGLCEQDQQTLTEFDDDGHIKRTWSEKENRVDKD